MRATGSSVHCIFQIFTTELLFLVPRYLRLDTWSRREEPSDTRWQQIARYGIRATDELLKSQSARQAARFYLERPLRIIVILLIFVFHPKAISPPFQAGSAPILTCRTPPSHNQGRS